MSEITREEILHLGNLARIRLRDDEVEKLRGELSAILEYVGSIDEVVKEGALSKKVGPVSNVFREDAVTCEPGSYTEAILAAMPERDGRYLKVKKILNPDE